MITLERHWNNGGLGSIQLIRITPTDLQLQWEIMKSILFTSFIHLIYTFTLSELLVDWTGT